MRLISTQVRLRQGAFRARLDILWLLTVFCAIGVAVRGHAATVWVESPDAETAAVTRHGWYSRLDSAHFSGGNWVSHYDPHRPGELSYQVEVPQDGLYRLWLRVNPSHSVMFYRFGDEAWRRLDMSDPIDQVNVAADGSLDHRFLAWIDGGERYLHRGGHRLSLRMEGGIANSGIVDCFALTTNLSWVPRGMARPGAATGLAEEGFFAWEPERWRSEQASVLCLRHLNEESAGQAGFVRAQGDSLVLGDGTPVRFWAVQADSLLGLPRERQRWWSRRLAAYGVNLARFGGTALFEDWMNGRRQRFEAGLDQYHALVAALREAGIYAYIGHLFWHTHTAVTLPDEVFPGFDGSKAVALLFFSERFQDYYLAFLRELLTKTNPYTGLSLAREPAVAFLEIQNESGLLFHTFNPTGLVEAERALVERKFGDWLREKYGSLARAQAVWGPNNYPHTISMYRELGEDDLESGRMRLYGIAHMRDESWARRQRNHRRAGDQLQFMVEAQRSFYRRLRAYLRDEIGVGQVIVPSNWTTADERILGALEHYTYTGADLIARNSYFGTVHEANPRFYRIEIGDQYHDRSGLRVPESVSPLHNQTYLGYPFMITENNWNRPNRFRVEWPFLAAAYGSLAGLDGWLFFALGGDEWDSVPRVWGINDTTVLGQFPAAALIFRRGDVRIGDPVVHEALSRQHLFALRGQAMRPAGGLQDPLYRRLVESLPPSEAVGLEAIDPLAFLVGRVTREVGGDAEPVNVDLGPYIDREKETIDSTTGELHWNYGLGVATVNTPLAQGATGFLDKAGRIELADIAIAGDNEYGAILVVSLDGRPLASSESILVQAATEDRTYRFQTEQNENGLHTIVNLGGYPLNVREINARVSFKRDDLSRATVLDGNGVPADREAALVRREGEMTVELPSDALYLWVR